MSIIEIVNGLVGLGIIGMLFRMNGTISAIGVKLGVLKEVKNDHERRLRKLEDRPSKRRSNDPDR